MKNHSMAGEQAVPSAGTGAMAWSWPSSAIFYPVWSLLDKLEIGQPIAWANVVTRMITLIYDAVGLETNQDKALFK